MGGTGNSKSDIDFGGRGMIKNDQNMFQRLKTIYSHGQYSYGLITLFF